MCFFCQAFSNCFSTLRRTSAVNEGSKVDGTRFRDENGFGSDSFRDKNGFGSGSIRPSRSVPSLQHYRQHRATFNATNATTKQPQITTFNATTKQPQIVTNPRIRRSTSRGRINGIQTQVNIFRFLFKGLFNQIQFLRLKITPIENKWKWLVRSNFSWSKFAFFTRSKGFFEIFQFIESL
jgi:hypothetical protein